MRSGLRISMRVKHLNPRQGITTLRGGVAQRWAVEIECEPPKSPPGDYNDRAARCCVTTCAGCAAGVKHLNPRQGITTTRLTPQPAASRASVKHLNPRQGITTDSGHFGPPLG